MHCQEYVPRSVFLYEDSQSEEHTFLVRQFTDLEAFLLVHFLVIHQDIWHVSLSVGEIPPGCSANLNPHPKLTPTPAQL